MRPASNYSGSQICIFNSYGGKTVPRTLRRGSGCGATRTPHVFLLDGAGVLRYCGAIDDNYDEPQAVQHTYLRAALDAVLSGQTPDPAVTDAVGCTIK